MTLLQALCVALGAAAGGCARYAITQALRRVGPLPGDALGTTTVNTIGALLLGALAHLLARGAVGSTAYVLLGVGFCGALTTWSTLARGVAELTLARRGLQAGTYLGANLVLGLLAVTIGWWAAA